MASGRSPGQWLRRAGTGARKAPPVRSARPQRNATQPAHLISLAHLANTQGTPSVAARRSRCLADGSEAHWDGTTWVAGHVFAPPPTNLPAPGRTVAAAAWNGGDPGAASADEPPTLCCHGRALATSGCGSPGTRLPTRPLYKAGTARVEVLDGTGNTVLWSTNNTAGNRISGLSVTGYQYGVNPVRIVMEYLNGTEYVVEVTT